MVENNKAVCFSYCASFTFIFLFQRILCRGNSIYVAVNTTDGDVPRIHWQDGQLVVSKRWQCNYKVSTPESYTVYAIVEAVKQTKDYFVELVAREAGYVRFSLHLFQ